MAFAPRFAETSINQYGSTEAGVAALTPFERARRQAGRNCPALDQSFRLLTKPVQQLPAGAEGLIRYRTPQLAENLKRAGSDGVPGVQNGWFYPGDIGTLTDDGLLRFVGRSSDVINRGGVKVSGNRIEEILRGMPQIKDAAACGVVGASGLEEIWIAVEAHGPVDIRRDQGHFSDEHVGRWDQPRRGVCFGRTPARRTGQSAKTSSERVAARPQESCVASMHIVDMVYYLGANQSPTPCRHRARGQHDLRCLRTRR